MSRFSFLCLSLYFSLVSYGQLTGPLTAGLVAPSASSPSAQGNAASARVNSPVGSQRGAAQQYGETPAMGTSSNYDRSYDEGWNYDAAHAYPGAYADYYGEFDDSYHYRGTENYRRVRPSRRRIQGSASLPMWTSSPYAYGPYSWGFLPGQWVRSGISRQTVRDPRGSFGRLGEAFGDRFSEYDDMPLTPQYVGRSLQAVPDDKILNDLDNYDPADFECPPFLYDDAGILRYNMDCITPEQIEEYKAAKAAASPDLLPPDATAPPLFGDPNAPHSDPDSPVGPPGSSPPSATQPPTSNQPPLGWTPGGSQPPLGWTPGGNQPPAVDAPVYDDPPRGGGLPGTGSWPGISRPWINQGGVGRGWGNWRGTEGDYTAFDPEHFSNYNRYQEISSNRQGRRYMRRGTASRREAARLRRQKFYLPGPPAATIYDREQVRWGGYGPGSYGGQYPPAGRSDVPYGAGGYPRVWSGAGMDMAARKFRYAMLSSLYDSVLKNPAEAEYTDAYDY